MEEYDLSFSSKDKHRKKREKKAKIKKEKKIALEKQREKEDFAFEKDMEKKIINIKKKEKKENDEKHDDIKDENDIMAGLKLKELQSSKKTSYTEYLQRLDPYTLLIKKGMVPNMLVDGLVFVSDPLFGYLLDEMKTDSSGMVPAIKQVANACSLPGILKNACAMPDIHCGYGFAIGSVVAVDLSSSECCVSAGAIGYDINCGVRLIKTNLHIDQLSDSIKDKLANLLYNNVPCGVGSKSDFHVTKPMLEMILNEGCQHLLNLGLIWPEDVEFCEEKGKLLGADHNCVSHRAKERGISQIGTLGSGNHYCEVQYVEEIYAEEEAKTMGITNVGQICIMIHCGSRGLGHQVCTDYLQEMDRYNNSNGIILNDRQLSYVPYSSSIGQRYLKAMKAAANFGFVNRAILTNYVRDSFSQIFKKTSTELEMNLIYDVAHNIAKIEDHIVNGKQYNCLVHRKGSTRSFPPHHPSLPPLYSECGQPVLIGGSMGTRSYVLVGTDQSMKKSFGSTCHGAGRSMGRNEAMRSLNLPSVINQLHNHGVIIKVRSKKQIPEEAPDAYKNIDQVIESCQQAGISRKICALRPLIVIKG